MRQYTLRARSGPGASAKASSSFALQRTAGRLRPWEGEGRAIGRGANPRSRRCDHRRDTRFAPPPPASPCQSIFGLTNYQK